MSLRLRPMAKFASLLLACLLAMPIPALAWNGAGHRLVAAIAWRKMTPAARQHASQLLRQHPDYLKWTPRSYRNQPDADYHAFLEASTWPDEIRHDHRFDNHPQIGERTLPGFPDMGRHSDWHFVNLPLDGIAPRTRGEIDIRLESFLHTLGNPHAPFRPYALPWVIHLLADLHQPLHVATRNEDEGGNRQPILDPRRHPPQGNLHSFWDQLPGHAGLRGERLEAMADYLLLHTVATHGGNITTWRDESFRLARDLAYPPGSAHEIPVITEYWRARAEAAAQRRLLEAGLRLAEQLNWQLR